MVRVVLISFLILSLGADAFANTRPFVNARENGVKTCIDAIKQESEIFLKDVEHQSHDFLAPQGKDVDKRPFFSMSFRAYQDAGISHITMVASPSYLGRRKVKCDVHVTETFISNRSCQFWSKDLSENQGFRASPLDRDIVLLENRGDTNLFTHYYLTEIQNGSTCLVTRRRNSYAR